MHIFGKLVKHFGEFVHILGEFVHIFGKLVHIFAWKLVSRTSTWSYPSVFRLAITAFGAPEGKF